MPKEKKDKKSKKQKKKELEEKRRLEEELLRQQQEEERKRQEELERQRREEAERLRLLKEKRRKEELLRLEKESEEDIDLHEKRNQDLEKLLNEQYQQIEWKKHLKCDPNPDISNERELNNFLTNWKENNLFIDNKFDINNISKYIENIESGYQLLQILQDVIFDAIQKDDHQKLKYAKNRFVEMGDIAQNKLDLLTQKCLKDEFFGAAYDAGMKEDGDVQTFCIKKNIKFGLWASSMSNAFKNSKIEFKSGMNICLELPKQIAMKAKMPLSCRVIQYSHNFYIYLNKSTKYQCIGPIINIQLLKLPKPPRNIYNNQEWMVQNITNESDKAIIWESKEESISISCLIPKYVLISDPKNIKLGWWDFTKNEWNINDFKDISFDINKRILSFITCHLSPISIISECGEYYEYSDWKLQPSGIERCKITLTTKNKFVVVIEIIGCQCKLLSPNIQQLSHIYQKLLKPHQLIRLLKMSGINLCYKNDENLSENLLNKNKEIEALTHLEISTIAALFEISMSKWNKIVDDNENIIIFRLRKPLTANEKADKSGDNKQEIIKEQKQNEEEQEKEQEQGGKAGAEEEEEEEDESGDEWQTIMINGEKCTFIDCNEKSLEINLNTPLRELSHKTLLRCLTSYCTEDNIRDLQNISFRFKETIRRMLNLLNLFRV